MYHHNIVFQTGYKSELFHINFIEINVIYEQ